jgi:hypothetical protein
VTTGGSDAHSYGELGRAYTVFPDGEDLKAALLGGRCEPFGRAAGKTLLICQKIRRRCVKFCERAVLRIFKKSKQAS